MFVIKLLPITVNIKLKRESGRERKSRNTKKTLQKNKSRKYRNPNILTVSLGLSKEFYRYYIAYN